MALDPTLVVIAEEAEGAHGSRSNELDSQDGVNLANKLVANVDGGLSYRAAEL